MWLTDKEVGDALAKLQFHKVRGSSIQRAEKSYLNFLMLLGLGREEEFRFSQLQKIQMQEIADQEAPQHFAGDTPQLQRANQWLFLQLRLEALIRAIYEAASVSRARIQICLLR